MKRRFGDTATIDYFDVSDPENRARHEDAVKMIQEQGLLYPVTFVDDRPVYDGAVSYPAVLRAVDSALAASA